ncbi:MAG TPA: rRNA maturation RNase YbeY [Flavobacteriaceae bacterium]|nr:rRNA maturation RNase YbeY [Flavobacteriaceae bacterium]
MIDFFSENNFELQNVKEVRAWLRSVIDSEGRTAGEIGYIFCDDEYLLKLNQEFLQHDTLTDIISFDDCIGNLVQGEIYISTERVGENAADFNVPFETELRRVMIHGILHFCGYKDKSEKEAAEMRRKEDEKLKMFHVEQ